MADVTITKAYKDPNFFDDLNRQSSYIYYGGGAPTIIPAHNQLSGLHGGLPYQHLTTDEYQELSAWLAQMSFDNAADQVENIALYGNIYLNNEIASSAGHESKYIYWGDTGDQDTYIHEHTDDVLRIVCNDVLSIAFNSASVDFSVPPLPATTNNTDIGSTGKRWKDLYIDNIYLLDPGGSSASHIYPTSLDDLHIAPGYNRIVYFNQATSVMPATTNVTALGGASNYWSSLHTTAIKLGTGATVDTIETTLTNDATHLPTSSAVYAARGAQISGTPTGTHLTRWTNATTIADCDGLTWVDAFNYLQITSGRISFDSSSVQIYLSGSNLVFKDTVAGTVTLTSLDNKVNIFGTPVNNQVAIWTGANTIEGVAYLTFSGTTLTTRNIVPEANNSYTLGNNPSNYWSRVYTNYVHFVDYDTYIWRDGSTNLYFHDAVTGTKTLAQLAAGGTPDAHAASHQNGGGDEISVVGLSGLLADGQTPLTHASSHEVGGGDLVDHDDLTNFAADEHINHVSVSIGAGIGLTGGGNITATRTLDLDLADLSITSSLQTTDYFGIYDNSLSSTRRISYANLVSELSSDLSFGSSNVSVANQGNNRIVTATAVADALNAEANLTWDDYMIQGIQTVAHAAWVDYPAALPTVRGMTLSRGSAAYGTNNYNGLLIHATAASGKNAYAYLSVQGIDTGHHSSRFNLLLRGVLANDHTTVFSADYNSKYYWKAELATTDITHEFVQVATTVAVMGWDDSAAGYCINVGATFGTPNDFKIDTSGYVYLDNLQTSAETVTLRYTAAGGELTYPASDKRLKTKIKKWRVDALDVLKQFEPKQFEWKKEPGRIRTGWIAQEGIESIPDMFPFIKKIDRYSLAEFEILPYFHMAIQQLDVKIETNTQKIKRLEEKVKFLESQIN